MSTNELAKPEQKPRKERPVPRRLVQVIDALLDGTCKSQKAACDRFGMSESYLSRSLKSARIRAFITRRTAETIAAAQLPATATVLRLLEGAKSEHVQFDAAKHMLGLAGHKLSDAQSVQINNNISVGYVIDLSGGRSGSGVGMIDATVSTDQPSSNVPMLPRGYAE